MSTEQTEAIVLRMVEFSETSLIVTLYTRDLGRVSAIAKGARRPKSAFDGALDLLAVCRIVVICKTSDSLDLLTEAKLQRRFRAGQRSLVRLHCGYYLAELLRLWTDAGVASPPLYELALRTLAEIDGDQDALRAILRFELRGLQILGHFPALDECVSCGAAVDPPLVRVPFAYQLGGVLCAACRPRHREVGFVRKALFGLAKQLAGPDEADPELAAGDYRDLRATLSRYIQTQLGAVPRTQSLLPTAWVSH
ncbi:MAG: DNA repair protein RecO [Planctomycetaceae bacterium]|nr:MAG: DNA repair protein RecO [Planctomycetaceae bacterium]